MNTTTTAPAVNRYTCDRHALHAAGHRGGPACRAFLADAHQSYAIVSDPADDCDRPECGQPATCHWSEPATADGTTATMVPVVRHDGPVGPEVAEAWATVLHGADQGARHRAALHLADLLEAGANPPPDYVPAVALAALLDDGHGARISNTVQRPQCDGEPARWADERGTTTLTGTLVTMLAVVAAVAAGVVLAVVLTLIADGHPIGAGRAEASPAERIEQAAAEHAYQAEAVAASCEVLFPSTDDDAEARTLERFAKQVGGIDYQPLGHTPGPGGRWVRADTGGVFGWSAAEDSPIMSSPHCNRARRTIDELPPTAVPTGPGGQLA